MAGSPVAPQRGDARALGRVAVSIVASGVLTYGYLALTARMLPVAEYSWFGSYWSLALLIGFGVFLPVELELTRLVQVRVGKTRLPAGTLPTLLVLTVVSVAALLAVGPRLVAALGGHAGFLLALLCVCAVSSGQFLLRGLLLGTGRLGLHGTVLLVDSGLRLLLAAGLALREPDASGTAYAWTLVAALAAAHLPLLGWLLARRPRSALAPGPAPGDGTTGAFLGAVGHLLIGALCAQILLNAAPVLVTGFAGPGQAVLAAQFVASYTLVRLPLFIAVPLQSAMIPGLVRLQGEGDGRRLRALSLRGLAVVAVVALLAAGLGWWLGPWVVGLVFGPQYALPGPAIALLAAGTVLHLGLLVSSQALLAAARHRRVAVVWLTGLLTACLCCALIPDLVLRAGLAFTAGSGAALAAAAVALLSARPAPTTASSGPTPRTPGGAPS